jgi:hypothetical protein
MNFEQALVVEFGSIPTLNGRVFPLFTGEGIEPPFLIYVSSSGRHDTTLNEFLPTKEINLEIHVVGRNYGEMKTLINQVLDKILTFRNRVIGNAGPFIKMVGYEQPTELFEGETGIYRASFDMRVRI